MLRNVLFCGVVFIHASNGIVLHNRDSHSLRSGNMVSYSVTNGTIDVGSCDKHRLCRDVWALYADQQVFCDPGDVFCQKSLQFRCTTQPEVYVKRNCRLEDCFEVRTMLTDAGSCAKWFPEIAESAMNRNPVADLSNPTQVLVCMYVMYVYTRVLLDASMFQHSCI